MKHNMPSQGIYTNATTLGAAVYNLSQRFEYSDEGRSFPSHRRQHLCRQGSNVGHWRKERETEIYGGRSGGRGKSTVDTLQAMIKRIKTWCSVGHTMQQHVQV